MTSDHQLDLIPQHNYFSLKNEPFPVSPRKHPFPRYDGLIPTEILIDFHYPLFFPNTC